MCAIYDYSYPQSVKFVVFLVYIFGIYDILILVYDTVLGLSFSSIGSHDGNLQTAVVFFLVFHFLLCAMLYKYIGLNIDLILTLTITSPVFVNRTNSC